MENMNEINNSQLPQIQTPTEPQLPPIETPFTPEINTTPSKSNHFKYLFIVCFIALLASVIYSFFIIKNLNSKLETIKPEDNLTEITPTIIPTEEVVDKMTPTVTSIPSAKMTTEIVNKVTPIITIVPSVKMTSDQIFQESSLQLGIVRNKLIYFRIFGQDKIQYSTGSGGNFAYKINKKWLIAQKDAQDVAICDNLQDIPEQYRPPCIDQSSKIKYATTNGASINYPLSQMVSYIGQ